MTPLPQASVALPGLPYSPILTACTRPCFLGCFYQISHFSDLSELPLPHPGRDLGMACKTSFLRGSLELSWLRYIQIRMGREGHSRTCHSFHEPGVGAQISFADLCYDFLTCACLFGCLWVCTDFSNHTPRCFLPNSGKNQNVLPCVHSATAAAQAG